MNKSIKCFAVLLIIAISLTASGCTEKEKKFIVNESPENYITFNPETSRVFMHLGSVDAAFQGSYVETETDYSIFPDNSREQVIFTKFPDGSISLAPNYPFYFYPAE